MRITNSPQSKIPDSEIPDSEIPDSEIPDSESASEKGREKWGHTSFRRQAFNNGLQRGRHVDEQAGPGWYRDQQGR